MIGLFDLLLGSLKSLGPVKAGDIHKITLGGTHTHSKPPFPRAKQQPGWVSEVHAFEKGK